MLYFVVGKNKFNFCYLIRIDGGNEFVVNGERTVIKLNYYIVYFIYYFEVKTLLLGVNLFS